MSRTVSALVTWDDTYLGAIGPVAVRVPWWVEVEPVVACLHEALGVPVFVLRLLTVEGGEGARDGHVTYHAAALSASACGAAETERPADKRRCYPRRKSCAPHGLAWRASARS